MSEAKVNSEDIEMVFQRLRALPVNKVNMLKILLYSTYNTFLLGTIVYNVYNCFISIINCMQSIRP